MCFCNAPKGWGVSVLWFLLGLALGAAAGALMHMLKGRRVLRQALAWWHSRRLPRRGGTSLRLLVGVVATALSLLLVVLSVGGDRASFHLLIGMVVGLIAGPWVTLHFSSDQCEQERDRYVFLTAVLGVVMLVYIGRPYLDRLMLDGDGFSLSVAGVSLSYGGHGAGSIGGQSFSLGGTLQAGGRHAGDTVRNGLHRLADLFGVGRPNSATLDQVKADMRGFANLSGTDRDRAYLAFLRRGLGHLGRDQPEVRTLSDYVRVSEQYLVPAERFRADLAFLDALRPLAACLMVRGEYIGDRRLFRQEVGEVVQAVMGLAAPEQPSASSSSPGASAVLPMRLGPLNRALEKLASSLGPMAPAACREIGRLRPNAEPPDGRTPYPAMAAAHLLAAIGAPERGIRLLSDWVAQHPGPAEPLPAPDRDWLRLRAEIAISEMAQDLPGEALDPMHFQAFQRRIAHGFAALLPLGSPPAWLRFCARVKELAPGRLAVQFNTAGASGYDASLGRWLAGIYASQLNDIYRLVSPAMAIEPLFPTMPGQPMPTTDRYLADDLQRSAALIDGLEDCFGDGGPFEETTGPLERWRGLFRLNLVQLHLRRAMQESGDSRQATLTKAQTDLELARRELGPVAMPDSRKSAADLLLESDPWMPARERARRLQEILLALAAKSN